MKKIFEQLSAKRSVETKGASQEIITIANPSSQTEAEDNKNLKNE